MTGRIRRLTARTRGQRAVGSADLGQGFVGVRYADFSRGVVWAGGVASLLPQPRGSAEFSTFSPEHMARYEQRNR
ncbi:hypothetical protein ACWEP4_27950 [Streptomyces sp. NPDC004227]